MIINVATVGAVAFIAAALVGRHYYSETYGQCMQNQGYGFCRVWNLQAILEVIGVLAVGMAIRFYTDNRYV